MYVCNQLVGSGRVRVELEFEPALNVFLWPTYTVRLAFKKRSTRYYLLLDKPTCTHCNMITYLHKCPKYTIVYARIRMSTQGNNVLMHRTIERLNWEQVASSIEQNNRQGRIGLWSIRASADSALASKNRLYH
jgi:hypothetical protein